MVYANATSYSRVTPYHYRPAGLFFIMFRWRLVNVSFRMICVVTRRSMLFLSFLETFVLAQTILMNSHTMLYCETTIMDSHHSGAGVDRGIAVTRNFPFTTKYREKNLKINFLPRNSTFYRKITPKFAIYHFAKSGKNYRDKYRPLTSLNNYMHSFNCKSLL